MLRQCQPAQVQELRVCGPRYWPLGLTNDSGSLSLDGAYRNRALFVQRRSVGSQPKQNLHGLTRPPVLVLFKMRNNSH